MPRYPHYIRARSGESWPTYVVLIDCESEVDDSQSTGRYTRERLAVVHWVILRRECDHYCYHGSGRDTDASQFWRLIARLQERRASCAIIGWCCTRLWGLLGLWGLLAESRAQTIVLRDPPMIARLTLPGHSSTVTLLDVRNWHTYQPRDMASGDATVTWLANWFIRWYSLCRKYRLGAFAWTVGSQAMTAWRTHYYDGGAYVTCNGEALGLEAAAYYGGRCEAYRLGAATARLHYCDIRSCYTSCMLSGRVPIRLCRVLRHPGQSTWRPLAAAAACIGDVSIVTDTADYPYRRRGRTEAHGVHCVPGAMKAKDTYDTDIIYPVGTYRTVLAGPEMRDALEHDRIRRVHALAEYECEPALAEYAQAVYEMRCECDALGYADISRSAKALANCLVGKLGQKLRTWDVEDGVLSDIAWGEWYGADAGGSVCLYRSVGGIVQRDCEHGLAADSLLSVAGHVTSAARMLILSAIRCAGRDHVYYCDTDAIMVDDHGLSALVSAGMLQSGVIGRLGIRWSSDTVEIRGIKHYVRDGIVTCAGLPLGHTADTGDGATYLHYPTAEEAIRRKCEPTVTSTVRRYRRAEAYNHGTVGPTGAVLPYRLVERDAAL